MKRAGVLFLLTQDLQSPSGLGRYLPLASELVRRGHPVQVAALHADFENLQARDQTINGVPVHYVAPMHVRKQGSLKQYYSPAKLLFLAVRAAYQLSRAALRSPADLVYICKPHPMNSIAGLAAKMIHRKKRLLLDCDDYEAASNRFSGAWQQRGLAFFEDRAPFWAEQVTSNTHFSINRMRALGVPPERLLYLPNGVDRSRFDHPSNENLASLRDRLGLNGKQVVLYLGSLSLPSHPVDLLLRAFARVHAACPGACLLIVGGGEDLPALQSQAAEMGLAAAVCFAGRAPSDAVVDYYRLGTVSVDPVYDNPAAAARAPLKMFESWAAGVPFVSVNVGDRSLLAGYPPAALLAEPGSEQSLAGNIQKVLMDAQLAEELRGRGRRQVEEYYWDRIVDRSGWIFDFEDRPDGR